TVGVVWVIVPLSSLQIEVTEPKVARAGSTRTNAVCFTILRAPCGSAMVITAGKASGSAATARDNAVKKIIKGGSPLHKPKPNTARQIQITISANCLL